MEKKKKNHDEIILLGKYNSNTIEVLISKAFIDSYFSHEKFVSVNNVSREYNEKKRRNKIFCVIHRNNGKRKFKF